MPWVERLTMRCGLKGRETVGPAFEGVAKPVGRALLEVADDIETSSRDLSGRMDRVALFPRASDFGASSVN